MLIISAKPSKTYMYLKYASHRATGAFIRMDVVEKDLNNVDNVNDCLYTTFPDDCL